MVEPPIEARARTWWHETHAAVCDALEPWQHGTIVRASRYPIYWDFNLVRVEDDPGMSVDELASFADDALAGLSHRRIDFDDARVADPLRAGFEERGWRATRVLWMCHEGPAPPTTETPVRRVEYEAVDPLRAAWGLEDFPDLDPAENLPNSREVALHRGTEVLASYRDDAPVAFAELAHVDGNAEIMAVYVSPAHRGAGLGTAVTTAAIRAAREAVDLWICADDEDRAKLLYARLGFRPAGAVMQFVKLPAKA
jgi:GNAT superfamily N-acetyltransferase